LSRDRLVLLVDGYSGYNALTDERREAIAAEALKRIAALYQIEAEIRGRKAPERRAVRRAGTVPLIDDLFHWLEQKLLFLPQKGKMADILRDGLKRREGLTGFLYDGTIEIGNNTVERTIRPVTLNRTAT
jgi:hypothetical protein